MLRMLNSEHPHIGGLMPKSNKAKLKAAAKTSHRRATVKQVDKAAEKLFRRHIAADPPPAQDPAAIVARMAAKRDLKPITVKTNCLHCALLSVMADWVEAGYCDTTTALHNMVTAVVDVLAVAPAAERPKFVAEVVAQIPEQVAFRTTMDAEGRARMH